MFFFSLSLSPVCTLTQVFSSSVESQIHETGDVALPVSPLRYFFPTGKRGRFNKGSGNIAVLVNWNGLKLEWLISPASQTDGRFYSRFSPLRAGIPPRTRYKRGNQPLWMVHNILTDFCEVWGQHGTRWKTLSQGNVFIFPWIRIVFFLAKIFRIFVYVFVIRINTRMHIVFTGKRENN